jgi:hypothetical protein
MSYILDSKASAENCARNMSLLPSSGSGRPAQERFDWVLLAIAVGALTLGSIFIP